MTKKEKHTIHTGTVDPVVAGSSPVGSPPRRVVEHYRQCPTCYHGELNGVGIASSTQGCKRYYKCDRCGAGWTAIVSHRVIERVEHRNVSVQTRDGAQITPRAQQ